MSKSASIGIIDYGMGNLRSVQKGFEKSGMKAVVVTEPGRLKGCDGIVIPGVGAFGDAMDNLRSPGMLEAIRDYIRGGRPLLGICLGMQVLLEASEEHGIHEGMGIIPGMVRRLPGDVKVPHMGWNVVKPVRESTLFDGVPGGSRFYFVHSYYCDPEGDGWTLGTTPYGLDFASAVGSENVLGLQFHPEKSSTLGLKILENFGRLVSGGA